MGGVDRARADRFTAQQHYNTFRERMAEFPISVELLSRFRSKNRQTQPSTGWPPARSISSSAHKLIQKNVRFKELGLVIIDEDNGGVLRKEKLKMLRQRWMC